MYVALYTINPCMYVCILLAALCIVLSHRYHVMIHSSCINTYVSSLSYILPIQYWLGYDAILYVPHNERRQWQISAVVTLPQFSSVASPLFL